MKISMELTPDELIDIYNIKKMLKKINPKTLEKFFNFLSKCDDNDINTLIKIIQKTKEKG